MTTRDEVYRRFGEVAELAQLYETEFVNILLGIQAYDSRWHTINNPREAQKFFDNLEAKTLGGLISSFKLTVPTLNDKFAQSFTSGLQARNRLIHGFFAQHNLRIMSEDGCIIMLEDLEAIHQDLWDAWHRAGYLADSIMKYLASEAH